MQDKFITIIAKLAKQAADKKEVPAGAIVIDKEGEIIGQGYNLSHSRKDVTEHAEIRALKQAFKKTGDWRLDGYTIMVNLEPCLMCLGAIVNARINKLIYFLDNPNFGSVASKLTKQQLKKLFPKLEIIKIEDKGKTHQLLKEFFGKLRNK
jgi:tRNA(adenine34) deaminase